MFALLQTGISSAFRQIYRCLTGDEDQNHTHTTCYSEISERDRTKPPPTSSSPSYSKTLPSSKPTPSPLLHTLSTNQQAKQANYENVYPNSSNSTTTTRSSTSMPTSYAVLSSSSPQTKPPPTSSSPSYSKTLPSSKPTLSPLLHTISTNQQAKQANYENVYPNSNNSTTTTRSSTSMPTSYAVLSSSSPQTKPPPSSSKTLPSSKPTLSPLLLNKEQMAEQANNYVRVADHKGGGTSLLIYMIPKEIENLIKRDIVPDILKRPLSPSTYKDYFAALLYAEDFYVEKWSNFQLLNEKIELHEASLYDKSSLKNKNFKKSVEKEDKSFAAFKIDSVPERRPFLLSRDFVYVRPSGSEGKKFQGIVYRVLKSTEVLVEFEEEFYSQHHRNRKYDISFSFNRVCLKRAHQAISAASAPLFKNYIFPERVNIQNNTSSSASAPRFSSNYVLSMDTNNSAVGRISSFKGVPPYLVEGPLCITSGTLTKTGLVVREAVIQIYRRSSEPRILICSTLNSTGDILMRSFKREIPESVMFRANAAFREVDGVPVDILPLCVYEGECFSFPSLEELKQFKVIFSTFVSSFRLVNQGIAAGHFSHIFLVDSSSATEPETMIPLSNYANEKTSVVLTGAPNNRTGWVRSDIARKNGLRMSYFERLRATNVYNSSDPTFITHL